MAVQAEPQWYDAQYNNRARVPQFAEMVARWVEASTLARSRLRSRLDLDFGVPPPQDGLASPRLDVFAAQRPGSPVLVFIHGGYWRSLDKSDHSFVAPAFVDAGAMVVVPNYSLCPTVTIEQITLQMVQALAWTYRHASAHGGDPERIVVVGHSAGAHLAAMLLACRWKDVGADLPQRVVSGAIGISGLYDLEPIRQTPFLQPDLQLTPTAVRRLSPAFFPRPRGPLYAVVGGEESDEFIRQNRLIRDQWGPSTVPICETVTGRNHFDVLMELVNVGSRTHSLALRLLGLD